MTYTVTYYNTDKNNSGGTQVYKKDDYDSATATAPTASSTTLNLTAPTSTDAGYDYDFLGWSYTAGAAKAIDDGGSLATVNNGSAPVDGGNYSLYAVWSPKAQTYTVNYYSGTNHKPETHEVPRASTENTATAASLGWTSGSDVFAGWYIGSVGSSNNINGNTAFSTLSPKKGDVINLYAIWTPTTFSVNYDANGGTLTGGTNPGSESIDADTLTSAPTATKTGYTFAGWAKDSASGTVISDKDGKLTPAFKNAITAGATYNLFATWTSKSYDINWLLRWDASGGLTGFTHKGTMDYETQRTDTLTTVMPGGMPAVGDTDNQYKFEGWYLVKPASSTWSSGTTSGTFTPLGNHTLATALNLAGATTDDSSVTVYGMWSTRAGVTYQYLADNVLGATVISTNTYYQGDTHTVLGGTSIPTKQGYTFKNWVASGTEYFPGTKITVGTTSLTFEPDWNPSGVNVVLNNGATDSTISLNAKSPLSFKVEDVLKASDLVTATPTRNGYDFAGWSKTKDGTVIIGGPSNLTYTVAPGDAPTNPGTINLFATWTKKTYTVRYQANKVTTDTNNSVKFVKNGGGDVNSPYTYTTTAVIDDSGFATPDITATYGSTVTGSWKNWYTFEGWGLNATATNGIKNTDQFGSLYATQGGTNGILDLYAIWSPVMFTINYASGDTSLGKVEPTNTSGSLTINLATGIDADVKSYTATATAAGYTLATPTWKNADGTNAPGINTSGPQAAYSPTIEALRAIYAKDGSTSATFRAYFTEGSYGYQVEAYLQKADGTWNTAADKTWSGNAFSYALSATYNTVVNHSLAMTSGSHIGRTLWEIPLLALYDGGTKTSGTIENEKLYDFDNSQGILSITIGSTPANNVLKFYYTRKTYDLVGVFQTVDASNTTKSGAPVAVTTNPSIYLNGGNPTTNLRWGQSVTVSEPTTPGYTFGWSITQPAGAASVTPGTSFVLKYEDMAKLVNASSKTAELTGTFTVVQYTITLNDTDAHSTKDWQNVGAGATLRSGSTANTKVASDGMLGTWVPDANDKKYDPTDSTTAPYLYYFAGWVDDSDSNSNVISSDTLRARTNWTGNASFTAVWREKVVITYDPGDFDSNGNSKADWTSASHSITTAVSTDVLANMNEVTFATLVNAFDSNGNPRGAAGWEFDYWTYNGDTSTNTRYGHTSAYPSGGVYYMNGTSNTNGFVLAQSYTFVAHWKGTTQTVNINNSGSVSNNTANTDTVSGTLPKAVPTFVTDDIIKLSEYTLNSVPAGYTQIGWVDGDNNPYTLTSELRVPVGGITLNPVFDENTVTFTYTVGSTSAGKGTITGTATDTVYAVKHNGITAHTAQVNGASAGAYEFVNWTNTFDGNYEESNAALNWTSDSSNNMGINGSVLTGDRTYYANFETQTYTITFDTFGTDDAGTVYPGAVTTGAGDNSSNGYDIEWNNTIPSTGSVNVTTPEGYELDGWLIYDAGTGTYGTTPQTFGTSPTSENGQGIMTYKVTGDVQMKAHFKLKTSKDYTVNYVYDPFNVSGFKGTANSRVVAWGDSVLPTIANDKTPAQAGYNFEGWYIDIAATPEASYTTAILGSTTSAGSTVADTFGTVYKHDKASTVDTGTKSVTIYAKWTAIDFTVVYDTYGNKPDDPTTTNDDPSPTSVASKTVQWNTPASDFWTTTPALSRGGFTFKGWSASVTSNGVENETAANASQTDTYGKLAGNNASNASITLHAIWEPEECFVLYQYDDQGIDKRPTATPSITVKRGWDEKVNYYLDPNGSVPSLDGWKFEGWKVRFYNGSSMIDGTSITAHGTTSVAEITMGNTKASKGNPAVELTAIWKKQSSYVFQDVLVHIDGSTINGESTTSKTIEGNSTVSFSEYGYPNGKTSYDGYDFDKHTPQLVKWATATPTEITVAAGATGYFYVYYIERSYTVEFFDDSSKTTPSSVTDENPWESAPVQLPTSKPTMDGYTFDGWYVTDGANETKLTGSNKLSDVIAKAPAEGFKVFAVGKWIENNATIAWTTADSNGTLTPATGSVARQATEDTAIPAITPNPATDYVFDKWTYSYVDASGVTQSGDVTSASTFAILTDSNGDGVLDTLEPVKWILGGSTPVWNNITFTAHFATSDSLPVTLEIYFEDGNNLGTYNQQPSVSRRDALDKVVYTVVDSATADHPAPTFAGYTFNAGLGDVSHLYDYDKPETYIFKLYYNADPHQVTYAYVENDGVTAQTAPTGATPLATFDGGTYYTGQTMTVNAAPTLTGYTFNGWYLSTNYGGTNVSDSTMTIADADVTIVGTWTQLNRTVRFIDADSSTQAYGEGARVFSSSPYTVVDGSLVSSAVSPAATTLDELGVTYNANGAAYALTGWDVLINGAKTGSIGLTDPLSYVVSSDVDFRAVWSETFTVTYNQGRHGNFTSVVYSKVEQNTDLDVAEYEDRTKHGYTGTLDTALTNSENVGNPNAKPGWAFVGWGSYDNLTSTWNYYFDFDSAIDYGKTVDDYGTTHPSAPTTVSSNINFEAFYKALDRTLAFSMHEYDSSVAVGTESSKNFNPVPSIVGASPTKTVKTGEKPTLLTADDVSRKGYDLIGWTDGNGTYTPGSTGQFTMPEVGTGTTVYLYPVFSLKKININYAVHSDSTGWGGVDRTTDTVSVEGDVINGSTPLPSAGYEFDYWTKDAGTDRLTDGVDANHKLTPAESGTYYAHFKKKPYNFAYDADPDYMAEVTQPTTTLPTDAVWTDYVTLDSATRPGYDFVGWDVYEATDWATNHIDGTKLHSAIAAGSVKVSDLSNSDGSATSLVLVPTFTKSELGVTYHLTDGTWSTTAADYPTTDPMYDGTTTDPAKKIKQYVDKVVDLRLAVTGTRAGYVLVGWQDAAESPANTYYFDAAAATAAGATAVTSFVMPTTNVDLYPIWQAKEVYVVTFIDKPFDDTAAAPVSNMPADVPSAPASTLKWDDNVDVQVLTGTTYSVPTRDGYEFGGWTVYASDYNATDGTGTVISALITGTNYNFSALAKTDVPANEHLYLVANWTEASDYNVIFVDRESADARTDDAVSGMPGDRKNIPYATADIDMSAPTRKGYTFAGWSSDVAAVPSPAAGTNVAYATLVDGDDAIKTVTLTAIWTENKYYKVTFDKHAGTETVTNMPNSPQLNLGWYDTVYTRDTVAGADPVRAGYVFAGWTIYNSADPAVALGGTDTTPYKGDADSYAPTFATLAGNDDTADNKELTLVAQWTEKTYKVTFLDGVATGTTGAVSGMPKDQDDLNYLDSIDATAPTRVGYSFQGWEDDVLPTGSNVINTPAHVLNNLAYATLVGGDDTVLSVTLTALWLADSQILTYVAGADDVWSTANADYPTEPAGNGASDPTKAITLATDAVQTLRTNAAITHAGSKLLGWANGTDKTATDYHEYLFGTEDDITMPAHDVTLYPIWQELGDYSVLFFTGDGTGATKVVASTMPTDQTNIAYAKADIDGHAPTRAGYTFAGWLDDALAAGSNIIAASNALAYADLVGNDSTITTVKLTATWTANEIYNVIYNDGVPAGATSTYSGATVAVPANMTNIGFDTDNIKQIALASADRPGFTFAGWKITNTTDAHAGNGTILATVTSGYDTDAVYSALVNGDDTITTITYTAMWEGQPYYVTYKLTSGEGAWVAENITDAGKSDPDAKVEYKVEQTVTLRTANTVTRDGYELAGWKTAETGGSEYKFPISGFTMPANDVDLYPIWNAKLYQVTFVANDGDGTTKVDATTMPAVNPLTGVKYDDTVVHAAPTRTGYTFGGWDITRDDTSAKIGTASGVAGSDSSLYSALVKSDSSISAITLTAVWTAENYSVTYSLVEVPANWVSANIKDTGASAPNNKVGYDVDATVDLRKADTATLNGYTLVGWKDSNEDGVAPTEYRFDTEGNASLTMPAKDVFLYAIWEMTKDYTVTFDANAPVADIAPGATVSNVPYDQPQTGSILTWEGATGLVIIWAPSFPGYTFKHWEVYDSNDNPVMLSGSQVTATGDTYFNVLAGGVDSAEHKNLKLKGVWEVAKKYNVFFADGVKTGETAVNDGTMPTDQTNIKYTDTVNYAAPTRNGYTFDGWLVEDVTTAGYENYIAVLAATPDSSEYYALTGTPNNPDYTSLRMTARWIAKTGYTVTFDANAGTDTVDRMPTDVTASDNLKWDDTVTTLLASGHPKRSGYSFTGWTIYNSANPAEVLHNTDVTLFKDDEATFAWLADNVDSADNAALVLVANWGPKTYSVEYKTGDDDGATKVDGDSMPTDATGLNFTDLVDVHVPTRPGYTFVEWTSNITAVPTVAGSDTKVAYNSLVNNDDDEDSVVLTAKWDARHDYNVNYVDGVDADSDIKYVGTLPSGGARTGLAYDADDIEQTALADADRPGYTFAGWKITNTTSGHANEGAELAVSPVTSGFADAVYSALAGDDTITSITYTAMWEPIKYTVTYHKDENGAASWVVANIGDAGAATPDAAIEYDVEANVDLRLAETVERAGYVLAGWANGTDKDAADYHEYLFATPETGFDMPAANVDLYPVWKDKVYSVTFDAAAGTETVNRMPADVPTTTWDAAVTTKDAAGDPLRKGYTFQGWTIKNANGDVLGGTDTTFFNAASETFANLAQGLDTNANATLTLVANWITKTYAVAFVANGSTEAPVDMSTMPADVSGLAFTVTDIDAHAPTRAGYDFVEWTSDVAAVPTVAAANAIAYADLVDGDDEIDLVTLTAKWVARMVYNVTYNNGVEATSAMPYNGTLPANRVNIAFDTDDIEQTALADADRPGYTFAGWKITNDADGSELAVSPVTSGYANTVYSTIVNGDDAITAVTYTAMWEAKKYEVTYFINGVTDASWIVANIDDAGAATPNDPIEYAAEAAVDLRLADTVERAGYTLAGWANGADDTAVDYHEYLFEGPKPETGFKMPAANVDLYPIWAAKTYKVFFDGNAPSTDPALGTVVVPDDQPVAPAELHWGDNVDATAATFTGYTFKGWTVTDKNGDVVGNTAADAAPISGGTYVFSVLANGVDSEATSELTLVANWELALIYNVLFKDGVVADDDFTPVTANTMPLDQMGIGYVASVDDHAPSRVGYTFDGWTVENITDAATPVALPDVAAADAGTALYYVLANNDPAATTLQLTAKWIANLVYNVHFVANDSTDRPANMGALADLLGIGWDTTFEAGPAPTRAGYTFTHWAVTNTTDPANVKSIGKANAEEDGVAVYYAYHDLAFDAVTKLQDENITDITLTAMWEAAKHTVTYVITDFADAAWNAENITDDGASAPSDPIIYAVDDTVELRDATTVVRPGYVLSAWQDDAATPNVYVLETTPSFKMDDFDVKLYPVWTAKTYTVTFDEGTFEVHDATLQVVSGMPTNPQTGLNWTSAVDTTNPTLPGYTFAGWIVENAEATGANTATLMDASYVFNELAITDTAEHATLNLIAQWTPAMYRINYVDPIDADGAVVATPTLIVTNDQLKWTDAVSGEDPWTVYGAGYAGKSADEWQFDGWLVANGSTGTNMPVSDAADMLYGTLTTIQGGTVADTATDSDTPALVLLASWTRRVPFVVDFIKLPVAAGGTDDAGTEVLEHSEELVGLNGDDLATVWRNTVLDMGDGYTILGYTFNRATSQADARNVGTLDVSQLGNPLHMVLLYDQILDYKITYVGFDGKGGWIKADLPTETTQTVGPAPAWETPYAKFAADDTPWFYRGHEIDHWAYGPTGTEIALDPSATVTFAEIAKAIYGEVDGTEGLSDDKPVTVHAVWTYRTDYKVVYDDNYKTGKVNNGIEDKFLDRIPDLDTAYTPDAKDGMSYPSPWADLDPTIDGEILAPGLKDENLTWPTDKPELYTLDGWNYSATNDGNNQKPAEGKTFEQIMEEMANNSNDPTFNPDEIKLYARWKEVPIELKYTPVLVELDESGNYVEVVGGKGGGTVSRTSETIEGVVTWTADGTGATMIARGATVKPNPGYHFVGWRRVSDGEVVYAKGWDPESVMGTQAMADGNQMPTGVEDGSTLFAVMQNSTDGYWHSEEYQALFAQNDMAILHYDKNADDATGEIADVEEPYGSLLTLSNGSPYERKNWTLTGWNTEPDGSGTPYKLGEKNWEMPQGETTLYAQWKKNNASMKYNANGSNVSNLPGTLTDEWGTTHNVSSQEPKRAHYKFLGWNTKPDGTGTTYNPDEEYEMPVEGITLYAQWEIAKYNVTSGEDVYKGGTVVVAGDSTTEIEYGKYVPRGYYTAEAEDGYHLAKWYYEMDVDGKKVTGYVDDPSELLVRGPVKFTPIFEKDEEESTEPEDEPSDEPSKPSKPSKTKPSPSAGTSGTGQATAERGGKLANTGDELGMLFTASTLSIIAALLMLLMAARRLRKQED